MDKKTTAKETVRLKNFLSYHYEMSSYASVPIMEELKLKKGFFWKLGFSLIYITTWN